MTDPRFRVPSGSGGGLFPGRFWILEVAGDGAAHSETVDVVVRYQACRTVGRRFDAACEPKCGKKIWVGIGCAGWIATASGAVAR